MNKFVTFLKKPKKCYEVLGRNGFFKNMDDEKYIRMIWKARFGTELNLKNPMGFNEKLQWLKLNIHEDIMTKLVDKYSVRKYITEKIGPEYCVPIIGVYLSVEEIPWGSLPDKCVIKCNHGSHCSIIKDSKFDKKKSIKKLNKWMKMNWYWFMREWPYKNVVPKIIIEEYLENIEDYKILCFHGKAKLFEIPTFMKSIDGIVREEFQDFYDLNWNSYPIEQNIKNSGVELKKPQFFHKMVELSEMLSKEFIHVRVDWTISKGKLFFGEFTFYDGAGMAEFKDKKWDLFIGEYMDLDGLI